MPPVPATRSTTNTNAPALPPLVPVSPAEFVMPLARAAERVTKKPFGIFITPQTSPVQPERFRGYHTGTDFETLPDEQNSTVAVNTICTGPIIYKQWVSGYGGVAIQACTLADAPITVLYGHLKLSSIAAHPEQKLTAGTPLGVLGKAYSQETDGERKHLHLGLHRGNVINLRGYVPTADELKAWIDFAPYLH